jgi:hypothetical protein
MQDFIMQYLSTSILALAFATVGFQANAQDAAAPAPDQGTAVPAQPDTAAPPAAATPDTHAPPAPETAGPASTPAPGADASAPTTIEVSDTQIDQFAKATIKLQKIDADAKLDADAKQAKMAAAVKSSGLDPARYNEIAKAIPTDDALRSKVQVAMAKYAKAFPDKG